ncbi:hypothetical protein PsasTeo6_21920 [Pseudomonas asiatica]|nr:hypothetical protein PsasTeo6_21920 [Pseudomonas asiatica]
MFLSEKLIDDVRDGQLELHCIAVCISQRLEAGVKLNGYGMLKINQVGTIYLEFICLEAVNLKSQTTSGFHTVYPDDPFDANQKLYLEGQTLHGDKVFAKDFSIQISVFNRQPPYRIYVYLNEIYFRNQDAQTQRSNNYMYIEMPGKAGMPANKMNTESNSYGGESSSWNETEIQMEETKVNIVNRNNRIEVRARGDFDPDDLYQAILFYIGLSSGVLPQPYCSIQYRGGDGTMHFKSIRKGLIGKTIPAPITGAAVGDGFPSSHFAILSSMLEIKSGNPLRFNSAYSQWQRVWHAFQSENNIAVLTLSVAVEGLLNDVFIPALKRTIVDQELEAAKAALIEQLIKIEGRDDHRNTLISSVERWGNIHAAKALGLLIDLGLVTKEEKRAWSDLRNSAAHPTYKEETEAGELRMRRRISTSLTLFYRLLLNIFSYTGPMYEFQVNEKPKFVIRPYVQLLE